MGIIAFIILGLLAGAIAKAILPGDDPGGIIVTAIRRFPRGREPLASQPAPAQFSTSGP